jgi:hypothetical protein
MYSRLDEVPVYEYREGEIPANYYNHVQVAFKRLGEDLRFPIPKLRHLDLILQNDAWIIVDRVLNDVPVVAWTDFQTEHRATLHEPIKCRIRLYHAHGAIIMQRTLEAMELILGEMLDELQHHDSADISPLKK